MSQNASSPNETHPLFPSGDWEGFYTYACGPNAGRHSMTFYLEFKNGVVTGSGGDEVGPFTWSGSYNTKMMVCKMTKHYLSHTVDYEGHVDENGIWGSWNIRVTFRGGFHVWPKQNAGNEAEEEAEEKPETISRTIEKRDNI